MTTRNLVPRATNEGKIGIATKKWAEVNATNATFSTLKITSLKLDAVADLDLFTNGPGIEDIVTNDDSQFVIALDDTFLTGLGFNADGSKPNFDANGTVLAGDSIVSAINKLDAAVSNVADPANLDISNFSADSITTSAEVFADNDTTLMTSAAIDDRILSYGYTTNVGDITSISAGTGLELEVGDGQSGDVTVGIANTTVTPGSYGDATNIATFTVDQQGRLTAAGTAAISTSFTLAADAGANDTFNNGGTLTFAGDTGITTTVSDDTITIDLDDTAVAPGAYGSATQIPTFTVDQQGRLTAAGTAAISTTLNILSDDGGEANPVALANDTLSLLGGTGITSTNVGDAVTFNLDDTAVAAAQYGDANSVAQFTVDAQGRLTQAASVDISITSSQVNDATADNTADKIVLRDANGDFSAGTITASLSGNATSADTADQWDQARTVTFAGGDVTGSFAIDGSANVADVALTISENSVTLGTDTAGDYVESLVAGAGVALANNAGESATPTISVDGVLEDLDTLGPATADGEFIVATGAGTFAYESGDTARTSLGVGTADSPEFSGLTLDNQGSLILKESNVNGDHSISIKSPASLTASYNLVLPGNDGNLDEVLVTDGDGNLSWTTVEAAAGNAVNAFSIIAITGQDNLEADVAQDTLNIENGSGISVTTNNSNGTDTLTISVANIDNDDIAAAAGIVDTKLATIATADKVSLSAINIDGATDIGAALIDEDLIIVDDGAGGTNRKSELSRLATYIRTKDSDITTLSGLTTIGALGNTITASGSLDVDQNLTVTGSLTVNGDQFIVDGTTVQLDDNLIELGLVNNLAPTVATTKDLGLLLHRHDGVEASKLGFYWDESSDKFKLESGITETDGVIDAGGTKATLIANIEGSVTGNSDTASALETARTIQISGDITGSADFNGSADINIATTIEAGSVDNSMLSNDGFSLKLDGAVQEDINLGDSIDFVSGQDIDITYSAENNALTVALEPVIDSDTTGNAATASSWSNARTITFAGGDVTGSFNVDGSADVGDVSLTVGAGTIETTMIANDAIDADKLADNAVVNASIDAAAAIDLNKLDWTSEGAVLADFAQNDKLFIYDTDTTSIKSITLSNLEDAIFGNVSGDVTIAAGGELTISDNAVTNDMLFGSIQNAKLANDSVSFGGVEVELGASSDQPAFDLTNATNYPTTELTGTISNAQLAGSISDDKLDQITTADKISLSAIDLDTATSLDNPLVASDLIFVDDGANGTNRSATLTQLVTFLQDNTSLTSLSSLATVGTITSGVWQGDQIADAYIANDLTISGGSVDDTIIGAGTAAAGTFTTLTANTSLTINATTTVTQILDEDTLVSDSATALATQQSIKAYVDNSLSGHCLFVEADNIDVGGVDSNLISLNLAGEERLQFIGGTGIDTSAAEVADVEGENPTNDTVTISIDNTIVATLNDEQTLTNKTLTSPVASGLLLSDSSIVFEGSSDDEHELTLTVENPTIDVTVTIPAATDTLVGKATTDTLTNKSIDADDGTNSITNLQTSNLKAGVLDTDLTTVSENDDTLASAKAIKAYVDGNLGRFGGIFLTDSVGGGEYDVVFDSSPLVRSHFGPFAFDLGQLHTTGGSDILFYGATAVGASDRHFLVIGTGDNKGDCLFTGADENTP